MLKKNLLLLLSIFLSLTISQYTVPHSTLSSHNYWERAYSDLYFEKGFTFGSNPYLLTYFPKLIKYYLEESEGISKRPEYVSSIIGFTIGITFLGIEIYGLKKLIVKMITMQNTKENFDIGTNVFI